MKRSGACSNDAPTDIRSKRSGRQTYPPPRPQAQAASSADSRDSAAGVVRSQVQRGRTPQSESLCEELAQHPCHFSHGHVAW